jgi:hypothetical protein
MFSCGTDAMQWVSNNCEQCSKYDAESLDKTTCEFSSRVVMGCFGGAPSKEEGLEYNCTGDPRTVCSKLVRVEP